MLELYHSVNSVCAQKVRVVLAEKGLDYQEHLMTLRGDQFDAAYMKLNPNAVVPTIVHDGRPVIESSVILYYLDEAFMPHKPDRLSRQSAKCARQAVEHPQFELQERIFGKVFISRSGNKPREFIYDGHPV
jgi:glutathione S-transferase